MGKENLVQFKPMERVEPEAYRTESLSEIPDEALREDTAKYLNEYRLKRQKDDYLLAIKDGGICNPFTLEPMTEGAKRSIELRKREGKPTSREKAELFAFQKMREPINKAENGDSILWLSPPGPKDQGYGDYGLVFRGEIEKNSHLDGQIKMTAYRVENPKINQFNSFFSQLTGENIFYLNAEAFLENPRVVRGLKLWEVEDSLLSNFNFKNNPKKEKICDQIIEELSPVIDRFIKIAKTGSREEKIETLNSLENMALELKKTYEDSQGNLASLAGQRLQKEEDISLLINAYKYEPPKAFGSCGPSSKESNNPFNKNPLNEDSYSFDRDGICKVCQKSSEMVGKLGPCDICRKCDTDLKKQNSSKTA